MIPNDVLSPQMQVDPIPEGTTVEFRLVSQQKPDARGIVRVKPAASLVGMTEVYDPFKHKKITIGNVTSTRNHISDDGKVTPVQRTSRVEFINGSLTLGSRDFDTYQYLMRRDDCSDNPFRNQGKPVKYKLVSAVALSQAILQKDMLYEMVKTAIRQSDRDQIQKLYVSLNPKGKSADAAEQKAHIISGFKDDLSVYLKVIKNMPDDFPNKSEIDVVATVYEAIEKNIITHDTQNQLWRWKDGELYPGIVGYPKGDDPMMKLIKHFKNNVNRKAYNLLQDVLAGKKTLKGLIIELNNKE